MKMTTNGKLLLRIFGASLVVSFCTATFGGLGSFFEVWMGAISIASLIAATAAAIMWLVDTLLENEE